MKPALSVQAAWPSWISYYEARRGPITWMYRDTKGLVTTGIGNNIDGGTSPSNLGFSLPWRTKKGMIATHQQVQDEYTAVRKSRISGDGYAYESRAVVKIPLSTVGNLLSSVTAEHWAVLSGTFTGIDKWPADAQLAIQGMAWWMGAHFFSGFPSFTAACQKGDFIGAAEHCGTKAHAPRDADHRRLFTNAAKVKAAGLSLETLWNLKPVTFTLKQTGKKGNVALDRISTIDLNASTMAAFSLTAWYVQRMLVAVGEHIVVDGKWGPQSKTAMKTWMAANKFAKIDALTLEELCADSKIYLKVV